MIPSNRRSRIFSSIATTALLAIAFSTLDATASFAVGTNYYINNQGACNDSWAGTVPSSVGNNGPWCNVSNVNSKAFVAGDSILLARGATWTSQPMQFTESGNAGNPITIDAYGSGARPILKGTNLATDRGIRLSNVSNWTIRNLEVSDTGTGVLFFYDTKFHENIVLNNLYVHRNVGIVKGVPTNSDNIYFSSGIGFTGTGLVVNSNEYVIRNVDISDIEGAHNQDSIAIDWYTGYAISGTALTNTTQNVKLSNLYLHDDDGHVGSYQSNSCSDSLRIVAAKNVTLTDSYLNNESSCFSASGTAAIFIGITDGVRFINNVISNVPNTGSVDQTGLDYEIFNDNSVVKGNYFGGNAGPGFEFLTINGTADSSSNHTVDGNTFLGNGGGGIKQEGNGGGTLRPSGTITNNLFSGPSTFLTTGNGGSFSDMTVSNTKAVSTSSDVYNAPVGFGSTQGGNSWSYQYRPSGGSWANLPNYDSVGKSWYQSTNSPWEQSASMFRLHPGACANCDVARAWTAPKAGTISIRGQVLKADTLGGDGVVARISKNDSRVWPSGSDQAITFDDGAGVATHLDALSVNAGDVIRFEVGRGSGNDNNDATSWAPTVAYTSVATPASVRYDDGDSSAAYSGSGWNQTLDSSLYGGNQHYSNVSGNYATFDFTGSSVDFGYTTATNRGRADVYVDGTLIQTVDFYSPSTAYQQIIFSRAGLTSGAHVLKIINNGTRNSNSTGNYIGVDFFDVATPASVRYDDGDSSAAYSGSGWNQTLDSSLYGGNQHYSNVSGNYATFDFTGSSVDFGYTTATNRGRADVYVDGTLIQTVDFYSPSTAYQQIIFSRAGLTSGAHVLKIINNGTRNSNSTGNYIGVDFFDVG